MAIREGFLSVRNHVRGVASRNGETKLEEALAVLIASTKRVRRSLDLVQVADYLEIARRKLGSLKAVGEAIGLSDEMLRQFASIGKLTTETRRLVAQRRIDSVDVAHRLSKLAANDQVRVGSLAARGDLSSDDVRAIVTLRKALPKESIENVIDRVRRSKNIREYLVQFVLPSTEMTACELRERFAPVLGAENIRWLRVRGHVGVVAANSEGNKRLQEAARKRSFTKRQFVDLALRSSLGRKR